MPLVIVNTLLFQKIILQKGIMNYGRTPQLLYKRINYKVFVTKNVFKNDAKVITIIE